MENICFGEKSTGKTMTVTFMFVEQQCNRLENRKQYGE